MRILILKFFLLLVLTNFPVLLIAEEENDSNKMDSENVVDSEPNARMYRNPEERREAGLGTEIFSGLVVSGLVELEKVNYEERIDTLGTIDQSEPAAYSLQIASEISINDWITAELIYAYEKDGDEELAFWDEAFLDIEINDVGINLGRFNIPLGEYYSHLVSGPLLEFSEIRGDALVVDYSPIENFELAIFVMDSQRQSYLSNQDIDWGVRAEFSSEDESKVVGISYFSDLAEAEEQLIEFDQNYYAQSVDVINVYALLGFENFELTAEWVTALDKFTELDPEFDQPQAWNLELAWFMTNTSQLAFRYEESNELEDEPGKQYGVGITWRPGEIITLSADYLHGEYDPASVFDDDDNELFESDQFTFQLSIEF